MMNEREALFPQFSLTLFDETKQAILDKALLHSHTQTKAWGISTGIDLFDCDPHLIRDEQHIRQFAADLCELLSMKTFGPCRVVRFGNPTVCGYSMTQLIETSLVSAHMIEQWNAVTIDIYSCAAYAPGQAAAFCRDVFRAQQAYIAMHVRGVCPLRPDQEGTA